jgi:hypothetical protein
MTRDARTLTVNEPVVLHSGPYVSQHGRFRGVVSNFGTEYLRVALPDQSFDVLPASDQFWLTDLDGHVLVIPEPVLETIPPDLE